MNFAIDLSIEFVIFGSIIIMSYVAVLVYLVRRKKRMLLDIEQINPFKDFSFDAVMLKIITVTLESSYLEAVNRSVISILFLTPALYILYHSNYGNSYPYLKYIVIFVMLLYSIITLYIYSKKMKELNEYFLEENKS